MERCGGHLLLEPLGAGPSGEVWIAEDDEGQRVRLKRLHRRVLSPEASVRAFEAITRAWTRFGRLRPTGLERPLATVLPDAEGRFCVVTSLRTGTPLQAASVPPDDARAVALGIGRVLEEVHDAGFVHGRLTPSNILVDGRSVVLLDFYWSQAGWASPPEEAAPEGPPATEETDIWYWGRAVELLFGAVARPDLRAWLDRAQHDDKHARFLSAAEGLEALSACLPQAGEAPRAQSGDLTEGRILDVHEAGTEDLGLQRPEGAEDRTARDPVRAAPRAPPPPAGRTLERALWAMSALVLAAAIALLLNG